MLSLKIGSAYRKIKNGYISDAYVKESIFSED